MRTALSTILAIFFLLPAPASATIKLTVWHSYRATEKAALEQAIAIYNGRMKKKVKVKLLAIPHDAYADKITAAVPLGHGPDAFIFAHDRIGDWAKAGILEPITLWVNATILGRFFPKTVRCLAYGGQLYGLPMAFKTLALYYNTAMVRRPPRTTAEMIALARKVTNRKRGVFGLAYQNRDFYYHAPWLHGFGGKVFSGNTLAVDSPASARALTFARDLDRRQRILPDEPTSYLVTALFNKSKAAMVINGPWFRGEISPKVRYAVAPLPKVSATGKPAAPFLTSEAVLLSKKSKHKRAAFALMRFLTSDEAALIRLKSGKQPVANKAAFQHQAARTDPVLQAFLSQLGSAVPMRNTPEMRMVWSPMLNALGKAFRGQATPAAALKAAGTEIRSYIKGRK